MNYDLDQDDIEDRCSMGGTDLTNVAEKELKDEVRPGGRERHTRTACGDLEPAEQEYAEEFIQQHFDEDR